MITKNTFSQKNTVLKLIDDIYKLTDVENAEYPPCQYCEGFCEKPELGEEVIFLPYEKEYICIQAQEKGLSDISCDKIDAVENNYVPLCPFLNHGCGIHKYRPFDCRSYPLIPFFKEDGYWEILFSKNCPYTQETSKPFFNIMVNSWKIISPFLSDEWKQNYNKKQLYIKK
jgi:Fe-S-cluster containining protein